MAYSEADSIYVKLRYPSSPIYLIDDGSSSGYDLTAFTNCELLSGYIKDKSPLIERLLLYILSTINLFLEPLFWIIISVVKLEILFEIILLVDCT